MWQQERWQHNEPPFLCIAPQHTTPHHTSHYHQHHYAIDGTMHIGGGNDVDGTIQHHCYGTNALAHHTSGSSTTHQTRTLSQQRCQQQPPRNGISCRTRLWYWSGSIGGWRSASGVLCTGGHRHSSHQSSACCTRYRKWQSRCQWATLCQLSRYPTEQQPKQRHVSIIKHYNEVIDMAHMYHDVLYGRQAPL
jgi:hypothetical protein